MTEQKSKPKVEVLPIEKAATPDSNNINKHTQKGGGLLENSLRKRGAFRSIASVGKGVDMPVVMAGNYTLEKAIDAGFTEVINIHVTGNQLVNVVRDDLLSLITGVLIYGETTRICGDFGFVEV